MFTVLLSGAAEVPSALLTHFLAYFIVAAASILLLTFSLRSLGTAWGDPGVDRWVHLTVASAGALGYAAFGVADELVTESVGQLVVVYKHGSLLVFVAFLAFALRAMYFASEEVPRDRWISRRRARYIEGALVALAIGGWVLSRGAETYVVADAIEIGGQLGFATYGTVFGLQTTTNDPRGRVDALVQHLVPVAFIVGVMAVVRLFGFGFLEHRFMFSMLDTFTVIWATFFASAAIGMIRRPLGVDEPVAVSTAD